MISIIDYIRLKPWPDFQNIGSMVDTLNLCGKFLLKFGAGWRVYMQLLALCSSRAVVEKQTLLGIWDSVSTVGDK